MYKQYPTFSQKLADPSSESHSFHIPVFRNYILKHILTPEDSLIVDATLGEGGHAEAFLSKDKHVLGIDTDQVILEEAKKRLQKFGRNITFFHENFKNIKSKLALYKDQVDIVLFDLGISRFHYFKSKRGFSFNRQEPLDMRLDNSGEIIPSARRIINRSPKQTLEKIFKIYGEEAHAKRYAEAIVRERKLRPFTTSQQLGECIKKNSPFYTKSRRIHPATKIFQALRIYINKEISVISQGILGALPLLRENGRLVIISYHSLEDRSVKNLFKNLSSLHENKHRYLTLMGELRSLPEALLSNLSKKNTKLDPLAERLKEVESSKYYYETLSKNVILPSEREIQKNHSARSAKMRVLIKKSKP